MEIHKNLIQRNFTGGRWSQNMQKPVTIIVLHTQGSTKGGVPKNNSLFSWFNRVCPPNEAQSAHFYVNGEGYIEQYVEETDTAWHCMSPYNTVAVGIEHWDGGYPDDSVRTNEMYESSAQLVAYLCKKWNIPCRLMNKSNLNNWDWGIAIHKDVPNCSTSCPAGLDYNRIIARANEILNPAPVIDPKDQQIEELKVQLQTEQANHLKDTSNLTEQNKALNEQLSNANQLIKDDSQALQLKNDQIAEMTSQITELNQEIVNLKQAVPDNSTIEVHDIGKFSDGEIYKEAMKRSKIVTLFKKIISLLPWTKKS